MDAGSEEKAHRTRKHPPHPKRAAIIPKRGGCHANRGNLASLVGETTKIYVKLFLPSSSSHSAHTHPMQSKHDSNKQITTEHYKGSSSQEEISAKHQTLRKLQAD